MPDPAFKKIPLKTDQYYQGIFPKKFIFLHHTAGGSAASSISGWAATKDRVANPYVIDRDGTVYECFPPQYWAYSLGVKGATSIEKATIAIEIANYGALDKNGKTYTGKVIDPDKRVAVNFRNKTLWERYTDEQIAALKILLPFLILKFKIPLQDNLTKFWEYQNPFQLKSGIYSHTTVRKDKIDIFPQKEIVDLVYGLK